VTDDDALKLTIYLGERDRVEGGWVADALTDLYARHELRTSLLLRGMEGFGARHGWRTDRLLTLSEDLPLVSIAVDAGPRIEAALAEVEALPFGGLITLERARLLAGSLDGAPPPPDGDELKLTVYVGRHERAAGRPATEAVVDLLHRQGVAGATVLLGVDGTAYGVRQRARFFGRNAAVPAMVVAVGERERLAGALPELGAMLAQPLATVERVRVCKRDGRRLAEPHQLADSDPSGLPVWQKLMVYASEQSRHDGHPLHQALVRGLRAVGASGATTLRGVWGYHGDHRPHGDSFWQLRRRVPVVTVIVDTPERIRRWFAIVDELTAQTGLVTSELVPSLRVRGTPPIR
jgi:PII-like signaling protein